MHVLIQLRYALRQLRKNPIGAATIPALRIARIDPAETLREE
jgi:hypothetical protein